jgi:HK97 family phage prohead protease
MEHKTFPAITTKVEAEQGIVEAIVAVMGNVDLGDDRIWPGAFTKTLAERGGQVKVLDQHNTSSVLNVLGKPLAIKEVPRGELPPEILEKYPEASGGLWTRTQYNLKTQAGHDAFQHIAAGDVDEYSFAYDTVKGGLDYTKENGRTIRNLRELKLYEYSAVVFGMNPATATLSAKADGGTSPIGGEAAKPYGAVHQGDKWRVYKLDDDGQPTGEALGEHDSEADANAQVRALYANEDGKSRKEMTPNGPVRRVGDFLSAMLHQSFTMFCDDLLMRGMVNKDERIAMSSAIGDALDLLSQGIPENVAGLDLDSYRGGMFFMALPARAEWKAASPLQPRVETKAGRVIAARNPQRITSALAALTEVLKDAGLMDPPGEADEDESKAGPAVVPPTEAELLALEFELLNLAEV